VDTTAATAGSSRTESRGRAVTVEDVTEERDRRTRVLTNEIEVVMMPESEYLSLSEGGEMEELKQQFKR
jgi:hypothetical protein